MASSNSRRLTHGTRLSYDYEAQVSGKVAAVGGRMLEGAAKVVLKQLFESLGRQAAGRPVQAGGSWLSRLLARFRSQHMKPAPFDYLRAMSTHDALDALAQSGEDARVLAGGQSLMAVLNMRLAQPRVLIDISRTDELNAVRVDDKRGNLRVSAAATQGSVEWRKTLARRSAAARDGVPAYLALPDPQSRDRLRLDRACGPERRTAARACRARRRRDVALEEEASACSRRRTSFRAC